MDNNTVTPKESDSNSNKRKRSPKENEGKASQKKTLLSYFHSSKDEGVENGIEISPEISRGGGEASSSSSTTNDKSETEEILLDASESSEEIHQNGFQLKSSDSENKENLNETKVEAGTSSMESQTSNSTLEEKEYKNKESRDSLQSVDENKNVDTNKESIQMNSANNEMDVEFVGELGENLNEAEVQPGPSGASQASTSGENVNDTEENQENIEEVDEENESEDSSQESSQNTPKSKSVIVDWRSSCYDVASLPNKARKEGLFTDIQFVMGEGEKRKTFHAHKSVLACASPVFEEMFFGPSPDERSIIETDDDPDAFEMLLEYIYTSRFCIGSPKTLKSVTKFSIIGTKYSVAVEEDDVVTFTSNFSICENDFWDVMQDKHFDSLWTVFCDRLTYFIMENAEQIISSEKFLNVPKTIVDCVLLMEKLNIEEHILLMAVTKWVYHNEKQVTSENLIKYYKHIRFFTISSDQIMQFIDLFPEALDAETYLQILQHKHNPSEHELPIWCTTKKRSRKNAYESSTHDPGCSCFQCENYGDDDEEEEIEEGEMINDEDELYDSDENINSGSNID